MGAPWTETSTLGVFPFPISATLESTNPTAVHINPDLMRPVRYFERSTLMGHPICNPIARLAGCPVDSQTLGKPGIEAIIGDDCNSEPHRPKAELTESADWGGSDGRSQLRATPQ